MLKTLNDLRKVFQAADERDHLYIGVSIKMPNFNKPEIIINTYSNFKSKLSYYEKAYNNDLTLKSNPNIKILNAVSSDYILGKR